MCAALQSVGRQEGADLHPQYSRHMEASAGWAAAANGARRVVSDMPKGTCERVGAQIRSLGGFEAAGGAAQDQAGRPGPWLRHKGQCGAAAGEGGRRVNRREGTWRMGSRGELGAAILMPHLVRVRVGVGVRVRAGVRVGARA